MNNEFRLIYMHMNKVSGNQFENWLWIMFVIYCDKIDMKIIERCM